MIRFSKRAAAIAFLAALPFVLLASFCWLRGPEDSEGYFFGDSIYLFLGAPLTLLVRTISPLEPADDWWAIPLMDFLFFLQWIIWAQLIALVGRFTGSSYQQWVQKKSG